MNKIVYRGVAALWFAFAASNGWAEDSASKTVLGFEIPGSTAAADALLWFELPDTQVVLEGAIEKYEAASVEVARVAPQLALLGFSISNFKTEIFPPSGRLRLVSKNTPAPVELVAAPADASMIATLVLMSAHTAKRVQAALGLEVVVMDVVVGASPSIKLSYLNSVDEAQLSSQLQDINDSCTAAP